MKLLTLLAMATLLLLTACECDFDLDEKSGYEPEDFWTDGYCRQTTVKTPASGAKVIEARLDDKGWEQYELAGFPPAFIEWNMASRMKMLKGMKDMFAAMTRGEETDYAGPELVGAHSGMIATWGFRRDDAVFSLNNAVKGMGFLPRHDKIKEVIAHLEATMELPIHKKIDELISMYEKADSIFAMDKQVSLELYANPEFVTQTFLNQMVYPASSVVFLDIPSYKLKTIARLIDSNDPELSDYEKDVTKYINLMHSYFHGKFSKEFIAVVYYTLQVFDNSPRGKDPTTGMGQRMVPLLP